MIAVSPLGLPLAEFLAVWSFLALNILTPGPNVMNTIALSMGSGRAAGMGAALGTGVGIGIWCLGMLLGATALLAAVPMARVVLTGLAAALLFWFASRYLRAARQGFIARRRGDPPVPPGRRGAGMRTGFARSLMVLLTNPKALTTWLAVAGIFPVARATGGDIALLCLGASVLAVTIHAGYALVFSTPPAARAWLRAAPVLNLGVGLFFMGFAIILATGLTGGN
jgi:threonine/homoserine/homoserine lactone efflux protein